MRFVAIEENASRVICASSCWHSFGNWCSQFFGHNYFERMKNQIEKQNPPQTAVWQPKTTAWLPEERLGDCSIAALTSCSYSYVLMGHSDHIYGFLVSYQVLPTAYTVIELVTALLRGKYTVAEKLSASRLQKIRSHGKATMWSGQNCVDYWNGATYEQT